MIVSGEADETRCARLESEGKDRDVRFAKALPLPHLAAVLENSIFVGHDSGISHLAAAAGAKCILLFGPTDPDVWAPMNENVEVIRAVSGKLSDLGIIEVEAAVAAALSAARCVPLREPQTHASHRLRAAPARQAAKRLQLRVMRIGIRHRKRVEFQVPGLSRRSIEKDSSSLRVATAP